MATLRDTPLPPNTAAAVNRAGYPAATLAFDGLIALIGVWIAAGLYLDGWYHNTFQDAVESFMTPWHAVLYSGVFTAGAVLVTAYVRNFRQGYHWRRSLVPAYSAGLIGFVVFGLSGLLDMAWHNLLGFEFDVEALLSPPHLALAASMLPLLSAPWRAAWGRTGQPRGWRALWPAVVSLLLVLSVFTFFTQFANAFTHANIIVGAGRGGAGYLQDVAGLASILIPTGLSMTLVLLALRRWALPVGALTFLFTVNAAAMYVLSMDYSGQHWPVLLAAVGGGVAADGLAWVLKPSVQRVSALRLFAFAVPSIMYLLYFSALLATAGTGWRVHMWLGATLLAGVVGLGLSYLLAPPPVPGERAV